MPDGRVKVSQLIDPLFVRTKKNHVLCYCDPLVARDAAQARVFTELRDVALASPWDGLAPRLRHAAEEKAERLYAAERQAWADANIGSRDARRADAALAIDRGYGCDDEYFALRLEEDWPGFEEVGPGTFFYEHPRPGRRGLALEAAVARRIGGGAYGAHTRLVLLKEHGGAERGEEALVIFGYLGRRDIFAPTDGLDLDAPPPAGGPRGAGHGGHGDYGDYGDYGDDGNDGDDWDYGDDGDGDGD